MTRIYISVGSNIEPEKYLRNAAVALRAHLGELQLSPVYQSEAVGFEGEHFLNMVIGADTSLGISDLVALLKQIELDNGRKPGAKKFSARTLDLDLLLFGDVVCHEPIELPRAEIRYNAFVLWPLADIAPEWVHPLAGQTYAELWQQFDKQSQRLWPVAFSWNDASLI
ncbi:2-amino-4-hydroxy-6-hydroxymethyldihydropteridinediphosphokinase [Shewanella amazonensis]|uniref:2-amino-4-hydroxy-6-hydroxymethyldihydropteridine diphosphokinase n=1 Tax=Shewanella amazonensis (strain ATCC BAA-1098 / SB2B) TaxID=326297 RepID=A1S3T1_SHEAM|nr:2-amino-4-hydroxy-6-hydroxymethyldihydropteridine diphosphokinase [Shewanella amazonensis]ABL99037.1 2-amino-4-hydroxy-6-hydroxymethyldihydropteridine pyrophosphokinase [Shewanella amazonensis SB2B]